MCDTEVCILCGWVLTVRGIYEVWGEGVDYETTKEDVRRFIDVEKVCIGSIHLIL